MADSNKLSSLMPKTPPVDSIKYLYKRRTLSLSNFMFLYFLCSIMFFNAHSNVNEYEGIRF
jgi:hypothetical protein